jgi:hypothetical protein
VRVARSSRANAWALAAASLIALAFASWIGGLRLIDPTEIDWVMKLDFQYHFLGWHFFRSEPWHFPPGLIKSYYAPIGTAIGFTDSIPLVAFALKPFSAWLPMPLQYFGIWLLICFALQGVFGVLLTSLWTRDPRIQAAGGVLFVLVPTLLGRVGHPALASHWLLLWALWMYWRESIKPVGWGHHVALGALAGLIHPYLVAMVMLVIGALAVRRMLERSSAMGSRVIDAVSPVLAAVLAIAVGWWASGLFSVSGGDEFLSTGLDQFSMNLLGPITPTGWSSLMPELPLASEFQAFEGFQYLGAGILALALVACGTALIRPAISWRASLPLFAAVLLAAVFALSPRITFGNQVVIDYMHPALSPLAVFRATGRFFWPAAYALLAVSVGVVASHLKPRAALVILLAAIAVQFTDLYGHYIELRTGTHSEEFHSSQQPLQSPAWHALMPHYKHLLLYGPLQCGLAPVDFPQPALLAGTYGLSINTGHAARESRSARIDYCAQLKRDFDAGVISDDAVYLVHEGLLDGFRANAKKPIACTVLDGIPVCVAASTYDAWKGAAQQR